MNVPTSDMWNNPVISVLIQMLHKTPDWDKRHDVAWYVALCQQKGFCNTDDMIRLCAERYLAGKRKVTPPGHRRKKTAEKARKKLLRDVPAELIEAVEAASKTVPAEQYRAGNDKALNALVGMVLKTYKTNASAVRELLIIKLKEKNA